MSHLIDRQALLDAMAELQWKAASKGELKGIKKACKKIKKQPSVQPETMYYIEEERGEAK